MPSPKLRAERQGILSPLKMNHKTVQVHTSHRRWKRSRSHFEARLDPAAFGESLKHESGAPETQTSAEVKYEETPNYCHFLFFSLL